MQHSADTHIPAAQDIQPVTVCIHKVHKVVRTEPVQLPMHTVGVVVDTVTVVDTVGDPGLDGKSSLEQTLERDTQFDTGPVLEHCRKCRKVDPRYSQLCFPCSSL